jgi:hypothetical protein
MLTQGALASVGIALGVGSHLGHFIHGEHHMQALRLFLFLITSPFAIFALIGRLDEQTSTVLAAQKTATVVLSYVSSLAASIFTYRIFFHPLRHFPGPLTGKLTKISHFLRLLKASDNYLQTDRLHKKYGDIVRLVASIFDTNLPYH